MLQLLLGGLTQTVIDYTVHIAGAALVQILFSNFAITIIAADFQLVHAVRMLGEQSLELVNQNPGSRLPDVLVHRRTYAADHPAVTVAATNLCTNFLCFWAIPQLIPSLIVQVTHWGANDPMAILFIKSDLRLVVDLQTCVKAQQSRAYAQKVKISNLQQMARTVAYVQEHGYDSREKLSETADAIYTKMAKARGNAKLTESKLRKTNEQIHYLGQYLSAKSIYGEFLKAPNKKIFRQAHSDELAQYEEALQILKQHSPDGKFPTMKDLRAEKEQLTIQKDAQYDTYHYFKDYHKELQTVCANVDSIIGTEQEVQQHEQQRTRKYEQSL